MSDNPYPVLAKSIRFVSSASGVDKVYRTTVYTSRVIAWALAKKYGADNPHSKRLANLSAPLTDTRMVLRLVGLLSSTHDILVNTEQDPFLRPISVLQAWSMIFYYPLENIYWFGSHGIVPMSEDAQNAASVWSCRAWLAYILLDFVADAYRLKGIEAKERALRAEKPSEEAKEELKKLAEQRKAIYLNVFINIFDMALALHWSLSDSPFPPISIAVAGSLSSFAGFYRKWKST